MLLTRGAVVAALVLTACGGSQSAAHPSPTPAAQVSASPAPASSPSIAPITGVSLVHCDSAVPAGDNLVIGTVSGAPTIVIRDIQDPSHARNLCQFDAGATDPQFVSGTVVAYEDAGNEIVQTDLATEATTVLANFTAGFDSGQYSVSPDGRSLTYLDGAAWRLTTPSGTRLLSTLPAVPGRGLNPDEDDSFLSFSPDGQYIALVQTFHTGGSGQTAADQVRRANDGTLVYSTSGMTMGVWASVPSRLFFRDSIGAVRRWDPSTGVSKMADLRWIRPKSSPDGRWIAYTFQSSSGIDGVGFYSVQSNSVSNTSPPGRADVRFLTSDLVWYAGERPCSTCFGGAPTPTGVTYIYDIAGASEVVSRLSGILDAWPHTTAPGL